MIVVGFKTRVMEPVFTNLKDKEVFTMALYSLVTSLAYSSGFLVETTTRVSLLRER